MADREDQAQMDTMDRQIHPTMTVSSNIFVVEIYFATNAMIWYLWDDKRIVYCGAFNEDSKTHEDAVYAVINILVAATMT